MSFPIKVPIVTLEVMSVLLSDDQPTPPEGHEAVLIKDIVNDKNVSITKLWMVFKVTGVP